MISTVAVDIIPAVSGFLEISSARKGILPVSGFTWLGSGLVLAAIICGCELNILTWFCPASGQAKWIVAVAVLGSDAYVKMPSLPFSVTELV